MRLHEEIFIEGSVKTYGAATNLMIKAWLDVVGEPLPELPKFPKERFKAVLELFAEKLRENADSRLTSAVVDAARGDPEVSGLLDATLLKSRGPGKDIDDVTPNVIMRAIYDVVAKHVDGDKGIDVPLDAFLRDVVRIVMSEMGWTGRINVGVNQNYPRLMRWMLEAEADLKKVPTGQAFIKIMNAGGGGRVAARLGPPSSLKVRITTSRA